MTNIGQNVQYAVRPPEYFPRLAYFALMRAADVFVLGDTFQYSRQSFQNRAKLRTPQGWQWITLPLRGPLQGCRILDVRLESGEPWRRKHWRAFEYNYRSTPFFEYYEERFEVLVGTPWESLGALTRATVLLLRDLLGVTTPVRLASELPGPPASLQEVVSLLDVTALVTLEEGSVRGRISAPAAVECVFFSEPRRRQNFDGFEPGLSALDLLFNYGPASAGLLAEMY